MDVVYDLVMDIISTTSSYGLIFNSLLIMIESIIPPLPLGFFVTILFINYGVVSGFLIAWISTIIGCIISFYLFQSLFKNIIDKYVRTNDKANKFISAIDNISFGNLVLIISIPFTPAFLVNIGAGISKVSIKKFIPAIIIGKISLVLFWGFIGTSLIDALKNPYKLLLIIVIVLLTRFISKIVNKKLKID